MCAIVSRFSALLPPAVSATSNLPEPNQMGHWLYFSEFGDSNTLLIISRDADVGKIVEAIKTNAGIGKIMVTHIEDLIDIQKNTKGEAAL